MPEPETYRLTFTTDLDDTDRAYRARARASGRRSGRIRAGVQLIVAGLLLFVVGLWLDSWSLGLNDVVVLVTFGAVGLVLASGAWATYVRRSQWTRTPSLSRPLTCTVSEPDCLMQAPGVETRYDWSALGPVIVMEDLIVLGVRGLPTVHYLPRKGLADDEQWSDLTRFVQSRLPEDAVTVEA